MARMCRNVASKITSYFFKGAGLRAIFLVSILLMVAGGFRDAIQNRSQHSEPAEIETAHRRVAAEVSPLPSDRADDGVRVAEPRLSPGSNFAPIVARVHDKVQNRPPRREILSDDALAIAAAGPPSHATTTLQWLRALVPSSEDFKIADVEGGFREIRTNDSVSAKRVTDEMLVRDVTLVMTFKEAIHPFRYTLGAAVAVLPRGMKMIIVTGGPCDVCREWVDEFVESARQRGIAPGITSLHVDDFATASTARRRASSLVETKYALFMNNDMFILHPGAIRELYGAAEWEVPDAAVLLPFILEMRNGVVRGMHGGLKNLAFKQALDGVTMLDHEVDKLRREDYLKTARTTGTVEQTAAMEDHVFFTRNPKHTAMVLFDPSGSLARNAIDHLMNLRYAGLRCYEAFNSWWTVALTGIASSYDMPFVAWRRNDYMAEATISYLWKKWNMFLPYSGFHVKFRLHSLGELAWFADKGNVPEDPCDNIVLVSSMAAMIGVNTMDIAVVSGAAARGGSGGSIAVSPISDALWHDAYPTLANICKAYKNGHSDMSIRLSGSLAVHKYALENPFDDNDKRAESVRNGLYGPVKLAKNVQTYPLTPDEPTYFRDIVAVQVRGVKYVLPTDASSLVLASSLCWTPDGGMTMDCVAWFGTDDEGAADALQRIEALSTPPDSATKRPTVSIIRRSTPGRPLVFADGPISLYSIIRVVYPSASPVKIADSIVEVIPPL
eukprot:Opistho-2@91671